MSVQRIPEEIEHLQELEHLCLYFRPHEAVAMYFPAALWKLSNLKKLEFGGLNRIPDEIGFLHGLEELVVMGPTSLPRTIENLRSLKQLDVYCGQMTELPWGIVQLSELRSIDLYDCRELTEIPSKVFKLPLLEFLGLIRCNSLSIPKTDILECSDSLVKFEYIDDRAYDDEPEDDETEADDEAHSDDESDSDNEDEAYGVAEPDDEADADGQADSDDEADAPGETGSDDETVSDNNSVMHKYEFELLAYMVRLNKAGRRLLRQKKEPSLALWNVVFGRCSADVDSLFFFVKQKPELIPDGLQKRKALAL